MTNLTTPCILPTTTSLIEEEDELTVLAQYDALFLLTTVATFLLNAYIIIVIVINKKLHVPVNLYNVSMCVMGIILPCVDMPFQYIYMEQNYQWFFGVDMCIFWYIFDFSACNVNLLNCLAITFIRYSAIVKPHADWAPKKVQLLVLCCIWLVPYMSWTVSLFVLIREHPPIGDDCYFSGNITYSLIVDFFAFFVPLATLIALNIRLIWVLRKRTRQVVGARFFPRTINVRVIIVQPVDPRLSIVHDLDEQSLKTTSSNNNNNNVNRFKSPVPLVPQTPTTVFKPSSPLKKEKKAILVLAILQIGFFICWMPFIVVFPMDSMSLSLNADFNNMVYWLGYWNSLFNSIVLIASSDNFQIICKKQTYQNLRAKLKNRF